MGRAALWALVACAWATASTPPPQSIDVLEVADAGRITGRAVAPESGDDVEVVFDLRGASEHDDGSPVFADVAWRRRRAPHAMRAERPVASVRLEEPFAVRTRVDHELLVRRRDTGGVLAHVDVRAARAGSAGDATRGVWDGGKNASEGRVRLRGGEVARARRSRRPRAFVGPVEHPPLRVGEDCEEKSADQRGFQPASRAIPTKPRNSLARSRRRRCGRCLDESIALVECSKRSRKPRVEMVAHAPIEVGWKIFTIFAQRERLVQTVRLRAH